MITLYLSSRRPYNAEKGAEAMKRFWIPAFAFVLVLLAILAYYFGVYGQNGKPKKHDVHKALEFYQQREEAMSGFEAVIERFLSQRPEIELYQRNVPNSQELLLARTRSGDVPDLFTEWPTQLNFMTNVDEKIVLDLADQPFMSRVSPRALDMIRAEGGGIYALPLNYNCMEIYYNTGIFERFGISVPQTTQELISLSDRLEALGVAPFVFCIRDTGRTAHVAQMILAATIDDYLNKLELMAAGKMDAQGKEALIDSFRLMRTLYGYGLRVGEKAYTYYEACELFAQGKSAMMISGSYALNTINSFGQNIGIDIFPFPGHTPGSYTILSSIDTAVCLSAVSDYRQEALDFLDNLVSEDNAALYASLDVAPSCINGVEAANNITLRMGEHIEGYKNANWLKSKFSLEAVSMFSEAVGSYLLSGDEDALWAALRTAFLSMKGG